MLQDAIRIPFSRTIARMLLRGTRRTSPSLEEGFASGSIVHQFEVKNYATICPRNERAAIGSERKGIDEIVTGGEINAVDLFAVRSIPESDRVILASSRDQ